MRTVLETLEEEAYAAAALKAHQQLELVKQMIGPCLRCGRGDVTVSPESFATRICPECAVTLTLIYMPLIAKQEKVRRLKKGLKL